MKLIIFENRIDRLEQFTSFELSKVKEATVITGRDFYQRVSDVEQSDTAFLDSYCCIAWHQSVLGSKVKDNLQAYCKKSNKPLILFSGSITSSRYVDIDFPYLSINSKDFYSTNLELFLKDLKEDASPNLLKIQFGKNWKLALMLSLRNRINVAMSKERLQKQGLVQVEKNELINRISDLGINKFVIADLNNEQTEPIFAKGDYAILTVEELQLILTVLNRNIAKMI